MLYYNNGICRHHYTTMIILTGCLAFPLFIIYDFDQTGRKSPAAKPLFFAGCLLLVVSSAFVMLKPDPLGYRVYIPAAVAFGTAAALMLYLLIFTLFFAIDFSGAYIEGSKNRLCKTGVYGACRHPGVVILFMFYLFASLALSKPSVMICGAVFSALNTVYVAIQDRYIFPKLYPDYPDYRHEVPFLLPTRVSIRECIHYYFHKSRPSEGKASGQKEGKEQ